MQSQNSFLPTEDAARKALPIFTFMTQYFPAVWAELTKVCVAGNIQHNPELAPTDIKWSRGKSTDQLNTAFRHLFDRGQGLHLDTDGQRHIIKAIWRLCAQAQLDIEAARAGAAAPPFVSDVNNAIDEACELLPGDAVWRAIADQRPEWVGPLEDGAFPLFTEH